MATSLDYVDSRREAFVKYQMEQQASEDSTDTNPGEDGTPDTEVKEEEETAQASTEGSDEDVAEDAQDEGTETTDEDKPSDEETAPGEGEADAAPKTELNADDLKSLWDAYGDQLLELDSAKERLEKEVSTKAQRSAAEQQRIVEQRTEVDRLIQEGTDAVNNIFGLLESASTELGKAGRDEEFNQAVLNPQEFEKHFNTYTRAVVAELRGRYTTALDRTILNALNDLPTLTDDQLGELQGIVNNAYRMEGDTRQAPEAAFYATNNLVNFLLARTRESAITEERTRAQSREAVTKKVTEQAAIKAAAAKLAAQRKNVPPKGTPNAKDSTDGEVSEDAYDRAIAAGDHDRAQRIVDQLARRMPASR